MSWTIISQIQKQITASNLFYVGEIQQKYNKSTTAERKFWIIFVW